MKKLYCIEVEGLFPSMAFRKESDRNEMALSLYEEYIYFLTMRVMNWYDEPILTGIEEDASSNIITWEVDVFN